MKGCGRKTNKELSRFLSIVAGSASEAEYLLILSTELKILSDEISQTLIKEINEIKKMLNVFQTKLNTKS